MVTRKITWSPSAALDLSEIYEYVGQDSAAQAGKLVREILAKVRRLKRFPNSGHVIPEIGRSRYRELVLKEYRIFHEVRAADIVIFRVLHSKRFFNG